MLKKDFFPSSTFEIEQRRKKSLLESHKIMFLFVRADWKGLSDFYTYFSFYLAYENALSSKENRAFKRRTMDALNALETVRWEWRRTGNCFDLNFERINFTANCFSFFMRANESVFRNRVNIDKKFIEK